VGLDSGTRRQNGGPEPHLPRQLEPRRVEILQEPGLGVRLLQMVARREWGQRSMEKGNCTAHLPALNDPPIVAKFGWAPAPSKSLQTAVVDPQDPMWGALDLPLRSAISRVLLGQVGAKEALDGVASNRQRIMRRRATL
jgi:hypothetical protein